MTNPAQLLIFLALVTCAYADRKTDSQTWRIRNTDFRSLYIFHDSKQLARQSGITALVNSFVLADPIYQTTLSKLAGENAKERVLGLAKTLPGSSPMDSLSVNEFVGWANELIVDSPTVEAFPILAQPNQSGNKLLKELHETVVPFVANPDLAPPILVIDTYLVEENKVKKMQWHWEERNFVVVVGMLNAKGDIQDGFPIRVVDSRYSEPTPVRGWIAARSGFQVGIQTGTGDPENEPRNFGKPLLTIHGEPLDAFDGKNWAQRRLVVASWVILSSENGVK